MIGHALFQPDLVPGLRLRSIAATQSLLGDTIALSDGDWQTPSGLPGWARAHVATHLVAHAGQAEDTAIRLLRGQRSITWTIQPAISAADLEAGSRRPALDLQTALDTSSAHLIELFDRFDADDWSLSLSTPIGPLSAVALFLARLNEVVLHHVDLRLGLSLSAIEPTVVDWLLAWNALRIGPRLGHLSIRLLSDEGFDTVIGTGTRQVEVRGSGPSLLGWLTGRLDSSAVLGAEGVDLGGPA
ncbi:MAG: maleylpyruvate isomerase family mycothiol-dependent enzyme [Propionibacteriaceae bacterium]|nr:maleylpyruvate isomerase family mycothiol-dependent enzyme [Propionibacteriaceae bacterium]